MEELAIVLTALLKGVATVWYCWLIKTDRIQPKLASWILFSVALCLSLVTYGFTESSSLAANIGNVGDAVVSPCILIALIVWGRGRRGFSRFDVACLGAAGAILVFWLLADAAFSANLALQALTVVGYLPTIVRLWSAERNTESLSVWAALLLSGVTGLYPAVQASDVLAIVHNCRILVLTSTVVGLIVRLEWRTRRNTETVSA